MGRNQYNRDGTPKLSSKQRRNAIIVAGGIIGVIGFLMWGLPAILPGVITAHNIPVAFHHHVVLTIIDDSTGQRIYLPGDIGNEGEHYVDRSLDEFGVSGLAPLHTHSTDSLIHIESTVDRTFTVGNFIAIWGDQVFEGRSGLLEVSYQGEITTEDDYLNHVFRDGESLTLTLT